MHMIYVFEYIETFYNTIRIHSHCGYMNRQINYEIIIIIQMQKLEFKIYLFYGVLFLDIVPTP